LSPGPFENPCLHRKYLFDMVFGIGQDEVKVTPCFSEYVCELLIDNPKESNKHLGDDEQLLLGLLQFVAAPEPTRPRKGVVNRAELNKGPCREVLCRKILHDTEGNIPVYPEAPCFKLDATLRHWADAWAISETRIKGGTLAMNVRWALMADLLHHALTQNTISERYYSFCQNIWMRRNTTWHCISCVACKPSGWSHCENCSKCCEGACTGCDSHGNGV
jgi:hypothetical protein